MISPQKTKDREKSKIVRDQLGILFASLEYLNGKEDWFNRKPKILITQNEKGQFEAEIEIDWDEEEV